MARALRSPGVHRPRRRATAHAGADGDASAAVEHDRSGHGRHHEAEGLVYGRADIPAPGLLLSSVAANRILADLLPEVVFVVVHAGGYGCAAFAHRDLAEGYRHHAMEDSWHRFGCRDDSGGVRPHWHPQAVSQFSGLDDVIAIRHLPVHGTGPGGACRLTSPSPAA